MNNNNIINNIDTIKPFIFSKLLLCQQVVENVPCETCHSCIRIHSNNHPNVTMIYPDGQTIKKGQMDAFLAEMTKKGFESGQKEKTATYFMQTWIDKSSVILIYFPIQCLYVFFHIINRLLNACVIVCF